MENIPLPIITKRQIPKKVCQKVNSVPSHNLAKKQKTNLYFCLKMVIPVSRELKNNLILKAMLKLMAATIIAKKALKKNSWGLVLTIFLKIAKINLVLFFRPCFKSDLVKIFV